MIITLLAIIAFCALVIACAGFLIKVFGKVLGILITVIGCTVIGGVISIGFLFIAIPVILVIAAISFIIFIII